MNTSWISYFAYGSNMSLARLSARVPSASPQGVALLRGYEFAMNLLSGDGSGKANIVPSPSGASTLVHGVLFKLKEEELGALDRAEGLGYFYDRVRVEVEIPAGPSEEAWTYVGRKGVLRQGLVAYDWYLNFIVHGARENRLDPSWIEALSAFPSLPDPDSARAARNARILLG